jgi:hypothetical protein
MWDNLLLVSITGWAGGGVGRLGEDNLFPYGFVIKEEIENQQL